VKRRLLKILGFAAFAAALSANIARAAGALQAWNAGGPAPKLILQITVDQLRGASVVWPTTVSVFVVGVMRVGGPHTVLHQIAKAASPHLLQVSAGQIVPIVFAGGSLTARRIYREIQTLDVAPTSAAIVGVKPPSGARGVPLVEVLQSQTGSTTVNP
jgi:hypothetical protein